MKSFFVSLSRVSSTITRGGQGSLSSIKDYFNNLACICLSLKHILCHFVHWRTWLKMNAKRFIFNWAFIALLCCDFVNSMGMFLVHCQTILGTTFT